MVAKRAAPGHAERGWFTRIGPFEREEDAYAAQQLVEEAFNVSTYVSIEPIKKPRDLEHPDDRRFSKWLLDHLMEHPNRAWDMEDLRIFAEENQYAPRTADNYIAEFIKLGICKRTQYGSIIVIADAVTAFRARK